MALIFTPDVAKRFDPRRPSQSGLLPTLAADTRDVAEQRRAQIEALAARVPEERRARVLGPLLAPRTSDDQVRDALGVLLLAAGLASAGWVVEHEPELDGGTPDLRIRKGEQAYVVEVRRVTGDLVDPAHDQAMNRIRDALGDLPPTRTPISIDLPPLVGGQASLARFTAEVRRLVNEGNPGVYTINDRDLAVEVRVMEPLATEMPVLIGGAGPGGWFDEVPAVLSAVREKVKRYKFPLIVALDLMRTVDGFMACRDAVFGTQAWSVSLREGDVRADDQDQLVRLPDGVSVGAERSAAASRERLVALLPFEWSPWEMPLSLEAELIPTPTPEQAHLDDFDPIPRLLARMQGRGMRQLVHRRDGAEHPWGSPGANRWCYRP